MAVSAEKWGCNKIRELASNRSRSLLCCVQGVSIHYITSIHYISNQVVVVVHYIFRAILVVVVNTNILRTTTPLQLFVQN